MFKLDSEEALLQAFRPKDRGLVELPAGPLPGFVRHYLTWRHPAGGRLYLVFSVPRGVPTGIVFDSNGEGARVPQLCEWCHHTGLGGVSLLTARVTGDRRAGVTVCADLSCQQHLEEAADRAGASALPALQALVERMGRFATEALRVDLTAAGR